jgi:hypothetical protein
MLSGRSLCDKLITRPEESYQLWCVVMCNLESSRTRRPWPVLGRSAPQKKKKKKRKSHCDSSHPIILKLKLYIHSGYLLQDVATVCAQEIQYV